MFESFGAAGGTALTTSSRHLELRITLRITMLNKLEVPDAKSRDTRSRHSVEPVCGIINAIPSFSRVHLRNLANFTGEQTVVALAYDCRRLHRQLLNPRAIRARP